MRESGINGPRITVEVWQDEKVLLDSLAAKNHESTATFAKWMLKLALNEETKERNS